MSSLQASPVAKIYKYDSFAPMVDKVVDAAWHKAALRNDKYTLTKGTMTFHQYNLSRNFH